MKQACFLPIECAFFGFEFDKNRLVNIYKVYIKISKNQVFSWGLPRAAIKTHAKGAYKTPTRVSFSMQNRGKLSLLWQFTLFVVSSRIAVGICSSLALENLKPLTVAQKGFLHDKERMVLTSLISEKMTDRTLTNTVGRLLIRFLL